MAAQARQRSGCEGEWREAGLADSQVPAIIRSVFQIDHVELFVPDRYEAAAWYRRVLGFEILPNYEHWAANPAGPLMISSDGGSTKLALFEGRPQESRATAGFHRVAFRVDADGFAACLRRLHELKITDERGQPITVDSAVDHGQAYSVYFSDPYGHHLEVTTYDYDATGAKLKGTHPAED
jgi:catechol 2,3-dioxygenase-like lactoylglutathione lyase family enzyme